MYFRFIFEKIKIIAITILGSDKKQRIYDYFYMKKTILNLKKQFYSLQFGIIRPERERESHWLENNLFGDIYNKI